MKTTELRDMTDEELQQRYREIRQELFNLRIQKATAQLEKASRIRDVRRDVARILTVMKERQKAAK